jgi:hypothetical protein
MPQRKVQLDISSLWQGTTNQPDYKARPGQALIAKNIRLDPRDGAKKRTGTKLVGDLEGTGSTSWVYCSFQDFIVRANSNGVEVYSRDNVQQTVTITGGANAYLSGAADLELVPYSNSVLILNRAKVVGTQATENYTVAGTVTVFSNFTEETVASGQYWEVLQSEGENPSGYYRATASNPQLKDWVRVAAPNDTTGRLDASTMPIQLLYANGTFTLKRLTWEDRKSGNANTNKAMPFVGKSITTMAFWQNRLTLCGADSVSTSETLSSIQDGFNLWIDDVANVVDTDPISLFVDLPNAGNIQRCAVVGRDVLLSCENGQAIVSSGDSQPSPARNNVAIRSLTSYKGLDIPLRAEGNTLVLIDADKLVHLYQYTDALTGIAKVATLNEHRKDVLRDYTLFDCFAIGTALFIPDADSNNVAVHDLFYQGQEIAQLAWSEYEFDRQVEFMEKYGSSVYLITQTGTTQSLLKYDHDKEPDWYEALPFVPCLDRIHTPTFISYSPTTNLSTFAMQGTATASAWLLDITGNSIKVIKPSELSGTWIKVKGNLQGRTVLAGYVYESRLRLTKLWVGSARAMLQRMTVFYSNATEFIVEAGRSGDTKGRVHTFRANTNEPSTGMVEFTILGDGRELEIDLASNSPGVCTWVALSYIVNALGGA